MADGEVHGPLVFQCATCSSVVGDSLELVATDEALQVLTLSKMTAVVRACGPPEAPSSGPDGGASFHRISCARCRARLGRVYTQTPSRLAHFREVLVVDVAALKSYGLGTAALSADAVPEDPLDDGESQSQPQTPPGRAPAQPNGSGFEHEMDVQAELLKVHTVLLALNERLLRLEAPNDEAAAARPASLIRDELDDERLAALSAAAREVTERVLKQQHEEKQLNEKDRSRGTMNEHSVGVSIKRRRHV